MARLTPDQYHVPVMLKECVDALCSPLPVPRSPLPVPRSPLPVPRSPLPATFVDATLGGGGHTAALLDASARVVAFDADEVAIVRARERFADVLGSQLFICHANFRTMSQELEPFAPIDGALFDLGVSSFQFDHHERGFSYRHEAPLDMRFAPEGDTAADLLNRLPEEEIWRIFRDYGEDPSSRKLAAAVARRRILAPYQTTIELRDTIVQHIPPQHHNKTLARIFQALRIAVNDELGALQQALLDVLPFCRQGARLVVMSYHSLEDRIVKDTIKADPRLSAVTKKPVMASPSEVAANPRARSARLRIAETVVPPSYLRSQ